MSKWDDDYGYYEPSRPREAKGGIKAQFKRGNAGKNWWAQRWMTVLNGFHIGARMSRGRSYARRGQVLSIDIDKGIVSARVQGSRPRPYTVEIKVKPLSSAAWKKLAKNLTHQALLTARLLVGQMPENIEEAFGSADLSLFPDKPSDLRTSCSCPDWSNPCKHVVAVYFLLGEEFDREPFLIFRLRGVSREEFLDLLNKDQRGAPARKTAPGLEEEAPPAPATEPLPTDPLAFWGGQDAFEEACPDVRPASIAAALPKRLGSFPFWRGAEPFLPAMERIYCAASTSGVEAFVGEWRGRRSGRVGRK